MKKLYGHGRIRLWPGDLQDLVEDPKFYPWLQALPPPAFERVMRAANLVEDGDIHHLVDDMEMTGLEPDFEELVRIGVAVEVEKINDEARRAPEFLTLEWPRVSKPTEMKFRHRHPINAREGVGTVRASRRSAVQWPATGEELREAGYRSTGRGTCESCGRSIIWARTPRGGDMPIEQVPDPDPGVLRFQSHFATCVRAEFHRRRKNTKRRSE